MEIKEKALIWASEPAPRVGGTRYIIVHHEAGNGSVDAIHRYHKSKGWKGIAYHFLVTKDGEIWRGRPENTIGGHTTNYNSISIGVCFEGNFEVEEMGGKQFAAGAWLLNYLHNKYPSAQIAPHKQFQATACPGRNFPLAQMITDTPTEETPVPEDDGDIPSSWAKEAVRWASDMGFYKGNGETPNYREPFTKEEVLTLLYRIYIKNL